MFCPQCATHNLEAAKFCRVCGVNLEVVSLALAGHQLTEKNTDATLAAQDQLKKKQAAARSVVQGSILLGVSLMIGLFGFVFTRGHFPWLFFWSIFFGWMACWGTISLAFGLGRVIEAKLISGYSPRTDPIPLSTGQGIDTFPGTSVTDHTTRQLGQRNNRG